MKETKTKLMRNQKGITLIALVITIIVLIILAGVAISMLSGENGILRKAAKAKIDTEEAQKDEAEKLATIEAVIDSNNGEFPYNISTVDSASYITGINIDDEYEAETVESFKNNTKNKYTVWKTASEEVEEEEESTTNMATGMIIKNASTGTKVGTVIVYGDVLGDGNIASMDFSFIQQFIIGKRSAEDYQIIAMDADNNKVVNITDGLYIYNSKDENLKVKQNRQVVGIDSLEIETKSNLEKKYAKILTDNGYEVVIEGEEFKVKGVTNVEELVGESGILPSNTVIYKDSEEVTTGEIQYESESEYSIVTKYSCEECPDATVNLRYLNLKMYLVK